MNKGIGLLCILLILPTWALAGYTGYFDATVIENTTSADDSVFTGLPDGNTWGIGTKMVVYDFEAYTIIDGIGSDLNLYEADTSVLQFDQIEVWISQDNSYWVEITDSQTTAVDVDNDGITGTPDYIQSYDLFDSGLSSARYVKILGIDDYSGGFDLNTICAINYTVVPAPAAILLVGLGTCLTGRLRRRPLH